jgi:glycosyltransferase involved in cell wall biosynthesis
MDPPYFSVIVPVHNGGSDFERCLDALDRSRWSNLELIVVDDGSNDGSAETARLRDAQVISIDGARGPGAARNLGAEQATGEYLFFVDADCEVEPETLDQAAAVLQAEPGVDALFGCYDDAPAAQNFVAQFKDATTFWAGCGVVRRTVFAAIGGFDEEQFPRPSIEDIELGYRLRDAGFTIRLCKEVRVKHLKAWTFEQLMRSDIFDRGAPWTRLMLDRGQLDTALNLRWSQRVSALLAWLAVGGLLISLVRPAAIWLTGTSALGLLVLNRGLYAYFARQRGVVFTMKAIPLHWFYYLYACLAFTVGAGGYVLSRGRTRRPPAETR